LNDDLLKNILILIPNETEAELLTGIKVENEKSANDAALTLLSKGIESILITLGKQGTHVVTTDVQKSLCLDN